MCGYNRLTLNPTTAVAKNISLFEDPVLKFYVHYICRVVLSFIWRLKKRLLLQAQHKTKTCLHFTNNVWGKQSELHHSSYMEARTSFVVAAFLDLKPGTPKKYDHQFSDSLIKKSTVGRIFLYPQGASIMVNWSDCAKTRFFLQESQRCDLRLWDFGTDSLFGAQMHRKWVTVRCYLVKK